MKIRAKFTFMMIILLNVAIVITGVFTYFKSTDIISNLTENSALELIKSQNEIISELIEKEILLLGALSADKNVLDLLADPKSPSKVDQVNNLIIKYTNGKTNLLGVFINDLNGISLATNNVSEVGMDLSDRNYHKKTISSQAPVISETLISKFQGIPIFVATRPIFDPSDGKLLGYVASAIRADSMAVNLKDMRLYGADSSYAYLIDENGNIIYHPDKNKLGHPVETPEIRSIISDIQNNKAATPTIIRYTEKNLNMISACSLIDKTKWGLVIVGNLSEFETPIRNLSSIMIIFGLLISIITSIIAFFMAKQISTPIIKNLEDKNQELSALYEEVSASEEELQQQIDELNEHRATILEMAYHDSLTHLANRALFIKNLNTYIADSKTTISKFAIVFLDLDNFKNINDTLGHSIGDGLLVEASKRLLDSVRSCDLVARLGGDEFAFIISNFETTMDVIPSIDIIMNQFVNPFQIDDKVISLTASVGISVYPVDGTTVDELLKNADTAMYKSKYLGKNTFQFYNDGMKAELIRKTELERMMRSAVEKGELMLYYQPQYHVPSRKLRGFEALIRWNNPEFGFLNPMEFIPIAEETGLIIPIGAWILKTACLMCKKIITDYNFPIIMSVNISTIQIKHPRFFENVVDCIKTSGIDPRSLELEVTESVFIGNDESTYGVLMRLRELGIGIAMDDFGTGYSSLSYLRVLPISLLKIDQSFIREIGSRDEKNNLTEAIISSAHKLNIETLAEGVETKEQLEYLTKSNCDYLQGYYFSKPVNENQISELFKEPQY